MGVSNHSGISSHGKVKFSIAMFRHEREKHPNSVMPAADPCVSAEPETDDKEDHKHNYHCATGVFSA